MEHFTGHHAYEPLRKSSRFLVKNDSSFPPPHDATEDAVYMTGSTRSYHMVVQGEIRILSLLPGSFQDSIWCYLNIRSIDEVSSYDALSYRWGSQDERQFIWLDGRPCFPVTSNLAAALRHIRHKSLIRYLWIDAICINQADIHERAAQVNMMKEIYSRADSVLVWIDEDLSHHSPCLETLSKLKDGECADELGADPAFWEPLIPILRNPYWDRLWIQQEIVSAKKLTIYCRGATIPGHTLMAFQHQIFVKASEGNMPFSKPSDWALLGDKMKITKSFSRHLSHWRLMLEHKVPVNPVTLKPDFSLRLPDAQWAVEYNKWGPFLSEEPIYLLGMLRYAQSLGATEPRDRVAATIHLAIDYQDDGEPFSYDEKVAEAYSNIARLLVFKCSSLLFLPYAKASRWDDESTEGLPSWAPNWNPPGNGSYFQCHYNASGGLPMYGTPFLDDIDEGIFYARGIQFDRIQRLVPGDLQTLTTLFSIVNLFFPPKLAFKLRLRTKEIRRLADTLTCPSLREMGLPSNYFKKLERTLYMALVLCYGVITPGLRISDLLPYAQGLYGSSPGQLLECVKGLDKFREQRSSFSWLFDVIKVSTSNLGECTSVPRFDQFVLLMNQTLKSGGLAVAQSRDPVLVEGTAVVRQGDEIWILFSCPVPMILRREGCHRLVISPSYIHNSMNGEQVNGISAPESRDPSGWKTVLETGQLGPVHRAPYRSDKRNYLVEVISIK
ncbi:hypothetical protein G7054_g9011 [Neopestalotiopsis clavispora]|nr:hypothetical protein G7054_g9011 [Neopestalotiopsis clavispora]